MPGRGVGQPRSHEEQARWDANEAEQTASYYLDQLLRDGEEISAIKKERDELLQRESKARERAREILSSAERDFNQRLAAEGRLAATEAQAGQDAAMISRLR